MNYEGRTRWKGHQDRQLVRIDSFVLKWSTKKVMISICQNRSFLRTGTSFITILIAVCKLKFIYKEVANILSRKWNQKWSTFNRKCYDFMSTAGSQNNDTEHMWKLFHLIEWEVWNPSLVNELQNHEKMNWIKLIWVEAESVANKIESTFHSKMANWKNSFWLTRYDGTRTFEMIWSDFMMDPKHNDELLRTESSSNE